jgi:bidirectional [NiFe] hydrogenase diaphorase subunit
MPGHSAKPPLPSDDQRWQVVADTMRRHDYSRSALTETLHTVQQSFGYLSKQALKFVATSLRVPLSQAYGVATFYHFFTLQPPGKHTCLVCLGTACYIKGAEQLVAQAEKALGIHAGETTPDAKASLLALRCIGSCGLAPVVVMDDEHVGNASASQLAERLERWMTHDR